MFSYILTSKQYNKRYLLKKEKFHEKHDRNDKACILFMQYAL